jgi:type VI secretion system ImpH/TssG family protein
MAGEDRAQTQHLTFLAGVAAQAKQFGLFPIVRGAEARAQGSPRVGRSKRPEQNIVDLAQAPAMGFADSTLVDFKTKAGRTKIIGYWLGLTGPMGPLPTHLTEFAFYERRYAGSQPFGDWLDLIAGRMLQLFYRAWADSQPAAISDRPDDDQFADFLSALTGAMEGAPEQGSFPPRARAHYAALFGGSRSAVAIEDGLSHLLGQQVWLQEFQGRWRNLEPDDLSRLGQSFAVLGGDAMLGQQVRSASDAFRVVIRAKNFRDYQSLLPTGNRFAIAAEALDAFKPGHLEWDICLEIDDHEAPPARLDGCAQLGWSSWVKPKSSAKPAASIIRADAHLRKLGKSRQQSRQGTRP